jgi:hypothetical protein
MTIVAERLLTNRGQSGAAASKNEFERIVVHAATMVG